MTLPAHLQKYQTRDIGTTLTANLGSAMPPHISIAGGRFTLIDASNNEIPGAWFDQKLGVYIDVCIVDANEHLSRTYFAGAYDMNAEGVRPDCFSDNGVAPSISASSPQARSCAQDPTGVHGCRWSVWGSKINANGKGVPACSEKQKLAVLLPGMPTVFLLTIPPKSGSHLRAYTELCKGNGIKIADVITRVYFLAGAVGELQFSGVNYIDEPTAQLRQAAWDEKKTDALVGRTDVARPAIAAPVQQQALAAPNNPNIAGVGDMNQPMAAPGVAMFPAAPAHQQVQQPAPFVPPVTAPVQTAQPAAPMATGAAFATQPASSTEAPAPARRRRRTAAEMQAAAPQGQAGQAPAQPAAAPQAPFLHPGQTTQNPGLQASAPPSNFGIAQGQPAAANPELSGMLDDFFKQG